MAFADWIASELGTRKWVVAARSTAKLREKYEVVLTQRAFSALRLRFAEAV